MSFTLIEGVYKIVNSSPDGDSLKFYPNNRGLWLRLNPKMNFNDYGACKIRLEAVDALETHYCLKRGTVKIVHQPKILAQAAANELLKFLGFDDIQRDKKQTVVYSSPEFINGFILTRFIDKFGRAVGFVFKGKAPAVDGSQVFMTKYLLHNSVNYHLLKLGLVYPIFYSKIYFELRQEMTQAVEEAQKNNLCLWQLDKTNKGFYLKNWETLTQDVVIFPKLFRHLASYLATQPSFALTGFKDFLFLQNDSLTVYPEQYHTNIAEIIEVTGNHLRLTYPLQKIVFLHK